MFDRAPTHDAFKKRKSFGEMMAELRFVEDLLNNPDRYQEEITLRLVLRSDPHPFDPASIFESGRAAPTDSQLASEVIE
ncbi:MAG TPA: hypothetical protein VG992_02980 [Candidatus Saccharimonadales bacterium]|nr:hypothetical protein [Candidatus Saccharimonadales bacterium]